MITNGAIHEIEWMVTKMRKYHLRPDGKLGRCSATKRKCRYSESPHFDNFEEGQKFLDDKIKSENKLKRLEEERLILQKQKIEKQIEERFEDWIYLSFEKISFKELREEYSDSIPVSVFAKNFIKGNCIINIYTFFVQTVQI